MATREIVDSTGDAFGVATYGTSTYGIINSRTFIPDGVKATSSLEESKSITRNTVPL